MYVINRWQVYNISDCSTWPWGGVTVVILAALIIAAVCLINTYLLDMSRTTYARYLQWLAAATALSFAWSRSVSVHFSPIKGHTDICAESWITPQSHRVSCPRSSRPHLWRFVLHLVTPDLSLFRALQVLYGRWLPGGRVSAGSIQLLPSLHSLRRLCSWVTVSSSKVFANVGGLVFEKIGRLRLIRLDETIV
mgnify:CR=1 FL=1